MATIKITNLNPAGSQLFLDSESYLTELVDDELNLAKGGGTPATVVAAAAVGVTIVGAAYAWGRWGEPYFFGC